MILAALVLVCGCWPVGITVDNAASGGAVVSHARQATPRPGCGEESAGPDILLGDLPEESAASISQVVARSFSLPKMGWPHRGRGLSLVLVVVAVRRATLQTSGVRLQI